MNNQTREPVANEPSLLLTREENEMVFAALGARRITKATAVAQVYHATPDPSRWTKYKTGVVCFVKDNLRKSYYIRLFEMNAKGFTIAWEQELYNQFTYKKDLPRFHHFPGDKFMVGLNFSNEDEADKFLRAMETKIKDRQQRRQTLKQRKDNTFNRPAPSSPPAHTAPPLPNTVQPNPPRSSPLTTIPEPSHNINVSTPSSSSNKGQKGKRKKINKSDISGPSNFQHLAHVGWDPSTGAFDSNNIDAAWKKLFDTVGVSDTDLKDENTAKFIYEFVEQHGGIEKANEQLEAQRQQAPPPPPSHGGGRRGGGSAPPVPPPHNRAPPPPSRNAPPPPPSHGHHTAPPLPPSRTAPPPPPSRHGGGGHVPAPPPPPPVNVPAPPPPPPVSSGGPPPPPPPSQSNKRSSNLPVVTDARANLMESIRAGKTLQKVEEQAPAEKESESGIAGALARALASRKDAIADTDSSDDDEYEDEEEDWSD